MSALSVLFIVLQTLAIAFFNALETLLSARRWVERHSAESAVERPGLKGITFRLSGMTAKAFFIAAIAGFVVVLLVTAALFAGGLITVRLWAAVFMAYSASVLLTIVRALVLKGYVPGLVTSLISVPVIAYTMFSLSLVWPWREMLLFVVVGLVLAVAGTCFARRLGRTTGTVVSEQ